MMVLVGRNNTGKSTILDLFSFVKQAAENPADAIKERGPAVQDLIWAKMPNEQCSLSFDFNVSQNSRDAVLGRLASDKNQIEVSRLQPADVEASDFLKTLKYSVVFSATAFHERLQTQPPVAGNWLYPLAEVKGAITLTYSIWNSSRMWFHDDPSAEKQALIERPTGMNRQPGSLPRLLFHAMPEIAEAQFAVDWLRSFFRNIYHVPPHRKPDPVRDIASTNAIDSSGRLLVDVLHYLRNNREDAFESIQTTLKRLVDGIEGISTPTTANKTTTRINEDFGASRTVSFDIKQTSTGTSQILVLLTQLYTQPTNGLILLEELESMLHPRAQAEFARVLAERSTNLTIMVSTHSPVIASETLRDSLLLVSKKHGATSVAPFEESMSTELIEEMGIRPSFSFEANTVIFVEGVFDEAVFDVWRRKCALALRAKLIPSDGYSNIQFFANADILHRKAVRVEIFAVVDGDTRAKGDYEKVKRALDIPATNICELQKSSLESYLAHAKALIGAFGSKLNKSESEVSAELSGKEGTELKNSLNRLMRPVGGYTTENATRVAEHIDPPKELLEFFGKIDASDKSLK